MKPTRAIAALSCVILVIAVGCNKQSRRTVTQNTSNPTKAAVSPTASSTATMPQKPATIVVFAGGVPNSAAAPNVNPEPVTVREAVYRLDLPQAGEQVALQDAARSELESALTQAAGKSARLTDELTNSLMNSLPRDFRDSCAAMVRSWGEYAAPAKWTVRLLYSVRSSESIEAVLGLRCAATARDLEQSYDERPAIVRLTRDSATLNFVPLAAKCDNCSELYRLEFSQAFPAVGARLAELRVYSSTDNPCCGGGEEMNANQMLILDLSRGNRVLLLDERTEEDSHDDEVEDGDTISICQTKSSYVRDAFGNLQNIATETQCNVDLKDPKTTPPLSRKNFRWNPDAHQFVESK